MATGGYRTGGGGGSGSTTDFLEEWKAKREKLRAKQSPPGPAAPGGGGSDAAGKPPSGALGTSAAAATNELNNNVPGGAAAPAAPGGVHCAAGPAALTRAAPGPRRPEDEPLAGAAAAAASGAPPARGDEEERDGAPEKGKSSGPSARKGKGQIEKRKLREKRRSTGVVNIPAAEVSRAGAARGRAGAGAAPPSVVVPGAAGLPGPRVFPMLARRAYPFAELGRHRVMEFSSEQMLPGKFPKPQVGHVLFRLPGQGLTLGVLFSPHRGGKSTLGSRTWSPRLVFSCWIS